MQEKIIQAFNWRAAVKSYNKEKPVDTDTLNTILESARLSATAYGLQPFRIINVVDTDLRAKLLEASYGQRQVVDAPHLFVIAAVTNIDADYVRKYIENIATTRGVTVADLKGFEDTMVGDICSRSEEEKMKWAGRQAYIALGSMLETAALLEVDAGPMEGFDSNKVDEILGLTNLNLKSLGYMVLGYRENDEYSKMAKVRLAKDDFVITL